MKHTINLQVTPQVAKRLRAMLDGMSLRDPIFAIAQHRRDDSSEPRLGVGVYERATLSIDAVIVEVGQLKFYIDPSMEGLLNGGTLDAVDGEFIIA